MAGKTREDLPALRLLERLLPRERSFAVRMGEHLLPATQAAQATVVLHPRLLERLAPPLDLALGEAYARGELEVEGDLEAVLAALEGLEPSSLRVLAGWGKAQGLPRLAAMLRGRPHSKSRDRAAIQHHYDLSNRFYELWLDKRMVYSCAYFPTGQETLDQAQEAKLEHICRKLRLRPGERLLDVGCGWGGLVIYAAQRYGVEALGITLSTAQLEEARARVKAAGLEGRVRIEALDYRDVGGSFDKAASVGMAEHVGHENLGRYFQVVWECLEPGGLFMHHVITRGPVPPSVPAWVASGEFMRRYIFPDGEILPLWQNLQAAEAVGFEVRDVEDLREHYARTLRLWRKNLEARFQEAVEEVGLERARLWRLYLAGSAHQFAYGHLSIHQSLLAKPGQGSRVELPPSRADLYRPYTAVNPG
ncbi:MULTISPECIES: cyclopropane-fatty-acyl-phospholipid synthase family protein [unclassified Meiothermus]|uniref:SAM-dependent methyltransferase n=1 Tax=unclassified Meiothermus TaxID=370471 RepID=UPI000D7BB127|nr:MULTISPECIES: cyclopropane-fatty-acyl-phospholipid synthase family protein [unclassified Meiothermus]PZA07334.1 SAM-dependent methyltransferase [Meiothermus sp. Pnk-1]RYM37328.1 class I SAM-dependent methyltransferase [Meiothermus sp. PNK-Is4]